MKENVSILDFIRITPFCASKDTTWKRRHKPPTGEKCLQILSLTRDMHSQYVKGSSSLIRKRNPTFKPTSWTDISPSQMCKPMKRRSPPLAMREMQVSRDSARPFSSPGWPEWRRETVQWGVDRDKLEARGKRGSYSGKQSGCLPHVIYTGWPCEPAALSLGMYPKTTKTHVHMSVLFFFFF